jgi:uncharacterized damage-inducible protein DinB
MLDYLLKLFRHEQWANAKLLKALTDAPAVPPRTQELLTHMFAAHQFWYQRMLGRDTTSFNFWPKISLAECAAQNEAFAQKWPDYLRALPQPLDAQTISFIGRNGTPLTLRVVDYLTQLHSHSIHHRAQIMLDMKAAGLEPVATDYIVYCMQNP